jgi:predicted GNAT family N-acyltransferase
VAEAELEVHIARASEVSPATLYRILQLRVDVFVVEQRCAYRELDGRDLEPPTWLLWVADPGGDVLATLRIVRDGRVDRIGRVATARPARSSGLAARLMWRALELTDRAGADVLLDAQSPLRAWYERFGFEVSGEPFVEDGIPHIPMSRRHRPV